MALKSLLLIRHTESLEDVDPTLHTAQDSMIPLTETGITQAKNLGETWSVLFTSQSTVTVYLSPSLRARSVWDILAAYFPPPLTLVVNERIRNLNWGSTSLQNRAQIEAERYETGVLNYQFPHGDNTPEYVRNINEFVEKAVSSRQNESSPEYIIIVTHGFALRIIAQYLLHISDVDFRWLRNPPNGYCLEITYNATEDSFTPTTPLLRMKPVE